MALTFLLVFTIPPRSNGHACGQLQASAFDGLNQPLPLCWVGDDMEEEESPARPGQSRHGPLCAAADKVFDAVTFLLCLYPYMHSVARCVLAAGFLFLGCQPARATRMRRAVVGKDVSRAISRCGFYVSFSRAFLLGSSPPKALFSC
jgi:hypothetical protein